MESKRREDPGYLSFLLLKIFFCKEKLKANGRSRTDDLIITNDLLYQLSYVGIIV